MPKPDPKKAEEDIESREARALADKIVKSRDEEHAKYASKNMIDAGTYLVNQAMMNEIDSRIGIGVPANQDDETRAEHDDEVNKAGKAKAQRQKERIEADKPKHTDDQGGGA